MQRLKATFRADAAFDHLLGGQDRRAPALYEDEALRRVEAVFLSAPCGCPMRTNGRGNRGGCHEPKVGIPLALTYVGFGPITEWLVWLGRWPALLAAVILMLALLYRYGPCRDTGPWRWVSPGSAIAAFLWLIASAGFSYYAANFGSYNETYGTLGAAIGLMTWLWISINIVLMGGEINSQLEERVEPEKAKTQP